MAQRDPWVKFYIDDWMLDPDLASCSLESQGFLMRLMGYLSRNKPYGYLVNSGELVNYVSIKSVTSIDVRICKRCIKELVSKGALKTDETGIYSSRMVSDHRKRNAAREYGKRGGNPLLVNPTLNPTLNPRVNLDKEEEKEKEKEEETPLTLIFNHWSRSIHPVTSQEGWDLRRLLTDVTTLTETIKAKFPGEELNTPEDNIHEEIDALLDKPPDKRTVAYLRGMLSGKAKEAYGIGLP